MNITEILNLLTKKINLNKDQASFLMQMILEGSLDHPQTSAVLVSLKMKGETTEEISSFATVMRSKSVDMSIPDLDLIDTCGTGGDLSNTFNISTAAAIISAGAGCFIAKHGNRSISSKCGSADVLEALGVKIQADPESIKNTIRNTGIGFMFAPAMHPAMKNVMPVRKSLGIRTVFNILGPLTNPARAKKQIIGVFDEKLCKVYSEALKVMGHTEAYIVHAQDGMDEVSISSPTNVSHLHDSIVDTFSITPEQFGIKTADKSLLMGGDAETNAKIIRSVISGSKGPARDISCLNAAFAIKLSGISLSLEEGYTKAQESIDSGRAQSVLDQWRRQQN